MFIDHARSQNVRRQPQTGITALAGMQERAEIVGGSCEAGPQPQSGFRVRAVLPTPSNQEVRSV